MQSWTGMEFAPALPWPALLAIAALALPILGYGVIVAARGMWWRWLVAAVAYLGLLNPSVIDEERGYLPDVAALVIDESGSQQIGARRAQTEQAAAKLRARLGAERDLELRTVVVGGQGAAEGTRLFEALARTLSDVPPERVAGAVLITDGQVHDAPAAPETAAFAGPVHVLLTGSGDERDRRLVVEQAPSYGIVGDSVTVTVTVDDPGAAGETVAVALRADGKRLTPRPVEVGKPTGIDIALDHAGVTALEFSVEAGGHELTLDNNRAVVVINGVRERLRVMLVSGAPSPGLRAWRNLLKADPAVDLVHFTILRPPDKQDLTPVRELSLIPFPSSELFATNLRKFDLIIFDRYHRRGILPLLYLGNVVDYVLAGGAVLDTAGPSFASPLSLATTPLAAILPGQPTGALHEVGFRPRLTAEGRRHPVTAGLSGSGAGRAAPAAGAPSWGRWFRLIDADVRRGAVLMRGADDLPLLVLDRVGKGRVAQLLSDQSWLWARGFEGGGPQQDLLRRLVHWLMKQPDLEEESLSARVEGNRIEITRRSLAPIEGAVSMVAPDGTTRSVPLADRGDGRAVATVSAAQSGLYRFDHGGKTAIAVVGVANPLEVADMRSTDSVLAPVAAATGGAVIWLARDGVPQARRVRSGRQAYGHHWIGLRANRQYRVTGLVQMPLLPAPILLALLLGGLILAWRSEGR